MKKAVKKSKKKVVAKTDVPNRMLGTDYAGSKAANYDEERLKQKKWHRENELILTMLDTKSKVLDVPVGTGRFIKDYKKKLIVWIGVDSSEEMLQEAKRKAPAGDLRLGDAASLNFKDKEFHTVVCVRLLHLVDEQTMRKMLLEACRVAGARVICTIQMRDKPRRGLNVYTHDKNKFLQYVKQLGWYPAEIHKITGAGWHVLRLERAK